jgi:hypothetical protein
MAWKFYAPRVRNGIFEGNTGGATGQIFHQRPRDRGDALRRGSSLIFSIILCGRQNFSNLGRIDRHGSVAVDDSQFSASGLVRDCRYLRLNNLAAGSDSDTRADAVAVILTLCPQLRISDA